jgi:hypothetical protein
MRNGGNRRQEKAENGLENYSLYALRHKLSQECYLQILELHLALGRRIFESSSNSIDGALGIDSSSRRRTDRRDQLAAREYINSLVAS